MLKLLRRPIYFILLGLMAFVLATACSLSRTNIPKSLIQPSSDCRRIQHSMGETCVTNHPQRLVALNPATLGNAIALGIQPVASVLGDDGRFPNYWSLD